MYKVSDNKHHQGYRCHGLHETNSAYYSIYAPNPIIYSKHACHTDYIVDISFTFLQVMSLCNFSHQKQKTHFVSIRILFVYL